MRSFYPDPRSCKAMLRLTNKTRNTGRLAAVMKFGQEQVGDELAPALAQVPALLPSLVLALVPALAPTLPHRLGFLHYCQHSNCWRCSSDHILACGWVVIHHHCPAHSLLSLHLVKVAALTFCAAL